MNIDKAAALRQVREALKKQSGGFQRDVNEFIPPKAKDGEVLEYKFIVLPPLKVGETVSGGGKNQTEMNGVYYYHAGAHFIDNTVIECPRQHDGEDCPLCQYGFDLMEDADKKTRSDIAKRFLSKKTEVINIYFPRTQEQLAKHPDLAGKTMWFRAPKTVQDRFSECIQNDDPGTSDSPEDQKPYGFFYLEDESYQFKLIIKKKGDYNDYEQSKFLVTTRGPIVKNKDGTPNMEAIKKILDNRHDLGTKFEPRDVKKLQAIVDKLKNKDGSSDNGFETEVDEPVAKKPSEIKKTVAESKATAVVATDDETEVAETPKETAKVKQAAPKVETKTDDLEIDNLIDQLKDEE